MKKLLLLLMALILIIPSINALTNVTYFDDTNSVWFVAHDVKTVSINVATSYRFAPIVEVCPMFDLWADDNINVSINGYLLGNLTGATTCKTFNIQPAYINAGANVISYSPNADVTQFINNQSLILFNAGDVLLQNCSGSNTTHSLLMNFTFGNESEDKR